MNRQNARRLVHGVTLAAAALGWTIAAIVHLAFGSPGGRPTAAQVRATLTELAIEKAGYLHGGIIDPSEVYVVGDTPNDIIAAKAVGAVAINVATGGYSVDQLRAAGSDHVMASLTEPFPGL